METTKQTEAAALWTRIVALECEQGNAGPRGSKPNATKYRALANEIDALRAERQQVLRG